MQLVQGSLVSYQGHTLLKACGGESLLVLVVTFMQPRAQMGSSPGGSSKLVAFAAHVITGVNLAVARLAAAPCAGGCTSALPPQQRVLPFAFAPQHCLGWSPGLHNVGAGGVSAGGSVILGD